MSQHSLDAFAAHLAELRDEHAAVAEEFGDRSDVASAAAYRMALSLLHIYTSGEYGEPSDKPSAPAEVAR